MVEIGLSLPPRHYDLVGEILIDALGQTSGADRPANTARHVAFEKEGDRSGRAAGRS